MRYTKIAKRLEKEAGRFNMAGGFISKARKPATKPFAGGLPNKATAPTSKDNFSFARVAKGVGIGGLGLVSIGAATS